VTAKPDLPTRLDRLERRNRLLALTVCGLTIFASAQATISCVGRTATATPTTPPQALTVSSLDVVNGSGEVVVHLGARTSGAGGVWLTDATGKRVLKLNQNERGGLITILGSDDASEQQLGLDDSGGLLLKREP